MVERNDANKLSTPFDDVGRPGVTDAGGYHGNDGAVLDLALLDRAKSKEDRFWLNQVQLPAIQNSQLRFTF